MAVPTQDYSPLAYCAMARWKLGKIAFALALLVGRALSASGEESYLTELGSFSKVTRHRGHGGSSPALAVPSTFIASACRNTLYPDECQSSLAGSLANTEKDVFHVSVQRAMAAAVSAWDMARNISFSHLRSGGGQHQPTGMDDCLELLEATVDQLAAVQSGGGDRHDVNTWLSAGITNQATCMESIQENGVRFLQGGNAMRAQARLLMKMISNSLALHHPGAGAGGERKLLGYYPEWVSPGDRRLLEASEEELEASADAVVARDGSGSHESIGEAISSTLAAAGGGGGGGRTVIYVKAGTYRETIRIPTKQKNVMLVGEGRGKSVIVSSRSAGDGSTTYNSATVGAMGAGFIGKGLTIINDAGPSKHQAVALRVGADRSVVTQCSIQGYQDTLYTHSNRQFYRDNDISGTVDFIFGNSAAVIQNCFIQARRANGGQKNSVTAQGRSDPNQNTGISIHNSRIMGSSGTPTYLGRPWHLYSRVAVLHSYLDGSINPAGWEPWSGTFALSTLYYAEYGNTGAGSSTSGRVRWHGVHTSLSTEEASKFTVANFIDGNSWLPATGVDYTPGL